MEPANLRRAWDISRACNPMCESPMSPSNSAWGTSAATESTTMMSKAPLRTKVSTISRACSPESGCDMIRFSTSTPMRRAKLTSRACSASIKAAVPFCFCDSRMACNESMVLPAPSGPDISTIRPLGKPPMPSAASTASDPVEIASISCTPPSSPRRIIDPLPYCFSICDIASSSALALLPSALCPFAFAMKISPIKVWYRSSSPTRPNE